MGANLTSIATSVNGDHADYCPNEVVPQTDNGFNFTSK